MPLRTKTLGVKDSLYRVAGFSGVHRHVSLGMADFSQEDEAVRSSPVGAAALFIAAHRGEDRFDADGGNLQGQAGGLEEVLVSFEEVGLEPLATYSGSGEHTHGDGLAVGEIVAGGGFETVTYSVTIVEDGAQAGLAFVLDDDGGLVADGL